MLMITAVFAVSRIKIEAMLFDEAAVQGTKIISVTITVMPFKLSNSEIGLLNKQFQHKIKMSTNYGALISLILNWKVSFKLLTKFSTNSSHFARTAVNAMRLRGILTKRKDQLHPVQFSHRFYIIDHLVFFLIALLSLGFYCTQTKELLRF